MSKTKNGPVLSLVLNQCERKLRQHVCKCHQIVMSMAVLSETLIHIFFIIKFNDMNLTIYTHTSLIYTAEIISWMRTFQDTKMYHCFNYNLNWIKCGIWKWFFLNVNTCINVLYYQPNKTYNKFKIIVIRL